MIAFIAGFVCGVVAAFVAVFWFGHLLTRGL